MIYKEKEAQGQAFGKNDNQMLILPKNVLQYDYRSYCHRFGERYMYYHRELERKISEVIKEYACVTLFGARQTGKSTMIRNMFPEYEYVREEELPP